MDYIAPFLLGIAILLVFLVRNQRQLQEKRQKIVVKEHRMFSFLHGLGEALQTSRTREELHQFILKGAMEVVEGAQGALYLLDMKQVRLVPKAMSRQCPPLLPQLLPNYDPTDPARLRSDLLLETVSTDDADSILVGCLSKRESLHVEDLSNHPAFGEASPSDRKKICCDAMLAPMYFGESDLGVMVVLRENGAASFDSNDFAVFGLLADQCSLALGTDQLSRQSIAQQRLEEEILNARDVQRILLPDKAPPLSGYRISGRNRAAGSLSGDYYDFIPLGKHALGVAIADVSGKGLPASLTMVMGRSVLRANTEAWQSPAEALAMVNRILHPDMRTDMFVSMIYLIAKAGSGEIVMARAGHDPALVYRAASKNVEEIAPSGLAVGVDVGPIFERDTQDHSIHLERGDILLLYTDGITEAENSMGDEFGIHQLKTTFADLATSSADEIMDAVYAKVAAFAVDSPQTDDMTMVVLEKT